MHNFTVAIIMLLSTLGPAAVIGLVGYSAVKAVGRNPSAAPRILISMIIAFSFAVVIAVFAISMLYMLFK